MSGLSLEALLEQRRAADAQASAWVSASAGSGKTKVLIDRLLNLLLTGARPHRLLCLTYTKAAAAEMANRLSDRLASWVTLNEDKLALDLESLTGQAPEPALLARARRLFAQVLDAPGGLRIQTLHAFAQSLLARFPIEAGVAPHFSVMDERDQAQTLDEALQETLVLARSGLDPDLARALELVTASIHESRFADLMRELTASGTRLARLLAGHGGVDGAMTAICAHLGVGARQTADEILTAACREEAFDGAALRLAVQALAQSAKTDQERAGPMAAWLAAGVEERVRGFDAYARTSLTGEMKPRQRLAAKAAQALMPGIEDCLRVEQERLLAVYENLRAVATAESTRVLLALSWRILEFYRHLKERRARLDYEDLISAARRLIQEGTDWILYKLDGGIDHVLIDEAQDTSPDQWDIVTALADEFFVGESARPQPRTLFAVGDVKQSIYSFQGADPDSFEAMRARLARQIPQGGGRFEAVDLVMSFRSTPAVLEAVDAVFAEGSALEGVDLGQGYKRHLAFRSGAGGSAELWLPLLPRALDEPAVWHPPVERIKGDAPSSRMARLLARRIQAMIGSETLESKGRRIEPGDILVLVRRRAGFVLDLVRALKGLGVAVAGIDRLVVTEDIAVADLMALARFALLPEDDLNLATVLKGPFLNFSEERLFEVCFQRQGSLWAALAAKEAPIHAWLAALLGLADRKTPYDFFAHLLGPLGGRRSVQARLGREALDAIDEFMTLALDYERQHAASLQGFLAWMEAGRVEIKRESEAGAGGAVRIMTVHGAKGLQAPVVFLPDTLIAPQGRAYLVWTAWGGQGLPLWAPRAAERPGAVLKALEDQAARQRRESHRLLYVAMTRAEDRLIMGGWQPGREAADAWYPLIKSGFDRVNAPETGDPWLAQDADSPGGTIRLLSCPQQEKAKIEEEQGQASPVFDCPDWAQRPAPPEPAPARPLIPSRPEGDEGQALPPLGADGGQRFLRGRLIHRLLQSLPDLAPSARLAAGRRYLVHAAAHWIDKERESLLGEVLAVIEDPRFAPLFGPQSRAEAPLVGLLEGRVLSGQVDRLALLEGEVWVADFKTNRPVPPHPGAVPALYRRQMDLYRAAAAHLWPTRRIRTFLLWTDGPILMEI
ncbi:MAG: double-strand break repair helicase AddA [Rhodospirillales bacterium]|jgi:ATP-dependent helicase/nuclease subunit A